MSDDFDEAAIFHEGLRLFNEADWFEAHEVWEDIWVMATGPLKLFYQGLIQCAVVMEHIRRGNPRGVRAVWATAVPKFDSLPTVYQGIHIPHLLEKMKQVVTPILELPDSRFDPALPRGQEMPYSPNDAPTITLEYDPFE